LKTTLESSVRSEIEPPSPGPSSGAGVVVIGGDFQGLGVARSLGRRGYPVCIIDDERSIARYSRYTTHFVRVKNLRDEEETIKTVMEVGKRLNLKGWVLYPTRDETVAAFSHHRDALSEWFRVPTPAWNSIQWTWDKRNTYQLAEKLGIAIPKTWFPRSVDDLQKIDSGFPIVIKPAIKEHFFYETKAKAWRADNPEELVKLFQQAAAFVPPGEIMIQDLIPGGSEQLFGYCAFFKDGVAQGTMVTQYQRQHPPQFGRSCTLVKTVDLPVVEELATRFLKAVAYYGLAELEFKLDPRDGQYKLLDVNARTWGYHSLGAAAGVDFSSMLFDDQLGQLVEPARARPGVRWIRFVTDIPTGILTVLRGRLSPWKYLQSVLGSDTESVFSFDDPLPSVVETALVPYLFYKRGF
jgi:D-aspartate ligase